MLCITSGLERIRTVPLHINTALQMDDADYEWITPDCKSITPNYLNYPGSQVNYSR